jgi:hypothetical protein
MIVEMEFGRRDGGGIEGRFERDIEQVDRFNH